MIIRKKRVNTKKKLFEGGAKKLGKLVNNTTKAKKSKVGWGAKFKSAVTAPIKRSIAGTEAGIRASGSIVLGTGRLLGRTAITAADAIALGLEKRKSSSAEKNLASSLGLRKRSWIPFRNKNNKEYGEFKKAFNASKNTTKNAIVGTTRNALVDKIAKKTGLENNNFKKKIREALESTITSKKFKRSNITRTLSNLIEQKRQYATATGATNATTATGTGTNKNKTKAQEFLNKTEKISKTRKNLNNRKANVSKRKERLSKDKKQFIKIFTETGADIKKGAVEAYDRVQKTKGLGQTVASPFVGLYKGITKSISGIPSKLLTKKQKLYLATKFPTTSKIVNIMDTTNEKLDEINTNLKERQGGYENNKKFLKGKFSNGTKEEKFVYDKYIELENAQIKQAITYDKYKQNMNKQNISDIEKERLEEQYKQDSENTEREVRLKMLDFLNEHKKFSNDNPNSNSKFKALSDLVNSGNKIYKLNLEKQKQEKMIDEVKKISNKENKKNLQTVEKYKDVVENKDYGGIKDIKYIANIKDIGENNKNIDTITKAIVSVQEKIADEAKTTNLYLAEQKYAPLLKYLDAKAKILIHDEIIKPSDTAAAETEIVQQYKFNVELPSLLPVNPDYEPLPPLPVNRETKPKI